MRDSPTISRIRDGARIGGLLRRWRDDLACCLPVAVTRALSPRAGALFIVPDGQTATVYQGPRDNRRELGRIGLHEGRATGLFEGGGVPRNRMAVLELPRGEALIRNVELPLAAQENLHQVLGFELDRLTPFSSREAFYACRVLERRRDEERLRLELFAAPRKPVEAWLSALTEAGLRPVAIELADAPEGVNLLGPRERPRVGRLQRHITGGMALLLLALIVAAAAVPFWQRAQLAASLRGDVDDLRRQVAEVTALRNRIEQRQQDARRILEERRRIPPVLDVLLETTRVLPDDTTVEIYQYNAGQLTLRGTADAASRLIGLLENSGMFESVRFESRVTQRGSGREEFHLRAELEKGEAGPDGE